MLITLTGLLLIVVPIAFNVTFFLLQRAFEYPDILRKPTDTILRRFKEGGAPLRNLWYTFAFSAVLFTPVPVMVQQVFQPAALGISWLAQQWASWPVPFSFLD